MAISAVSVGLFGISVYKIFIEQSSAFRMIFFQIAMVGCLDCTMGNFSKKKMAEDLLKNHKRDEAYILHTC